MFDSSSVGADARRLKRSELLSNLNGIGERNGVKRCERCEMDDIVSKMRRLGKMRRKCKSGSGWNGGEANGGNPGATYVTGPTNDT